MTDPQTPEAATELLEPSGSASREAARYRRQLREVEAARDTLQAALHATRQTLLDRTLTDYMTVEYVPTEGNIPHTPEGEPKPLSAKIRLKHPSDFAQFTGQSSDDFLSDDGTLNSDKVQTALTELWQKRPELFDDATSGVTPTIGINPGRATSSNADFTTAFSPKK